MLEIVTIPVGPLSTNCYLLTDTDTNAQLVVDPGASPEKILLALTSTPGNVQYIFLTHTHFDHLQALDAIREATNAPVVVHEAETEELEHPAKTPFFVPKGDHAPAEITVKGGETFSFGNGTLKVYHTPGHSQGSICLQIDDILFTGDTLFEDDCGRTDFPGGNPLAMNASLRFLASLPGDYRVFPGHDVSTTLSRERNLNCSMLQALAEVQ
jgi:glyoxylase-like metal-dependent hydrolase (beta-lactamase superfamily II)